MQNVYYCAIIIEIMFLARDVYRGKDEVMANNESLLGEWKDTVYNLGGAIYGLGKTVCKSVKVGVDKVYDRLNEDDHMTKKPSTNVKKADEE